MRIANAKKEFYSPGRKRSGFFIIQIRLTGTSWAFIAPQQMARWSMRKMLKDAGNQSVFWSGFGAFWAMYTLQEWLAIFGLLIGLISGLVNMYAKFEESKVRQNEERRADELHKLKMEQLKRGLRDGTIED